MVRTAIFPGSFDPVTLGHVNIIERAFPLFDEIILAVGKNADKEYLFSLEKRIHWLQKIFVNNPKIKVRGYNGLTINFAQKCKASFLIRGLRDSSDFEFEKSMAQVNRQLDPKIDTVFFLTSAQLSFISSSIVRDIIKHGGDFSKFVPTNVEI